MLEQAFSKTRLHTEQLCAPLLTEDFVPQAAAFASPPKWNLGHTTWFFEEMLLRPFVGGYKVFDSTFGFLFNSYYNGLGDRVARHQRGLISRPSVQEVMDYRKYVDQAMVKLLNNSHDPRINELTILGINHEQQHQELFLTDLKYTFYQNPLRPPYDAEMNLVSRKNTEQGWVSMEEGIYAIGHNGDGGFCFDNELERHRVLLEAYRISKAFVTNGEFMAFMADGGYKDFRHWHDEGWTWVADNGICAPLYWEQTDGQWQHYTLAGMQAVDADAVVAHLSFYEAAAFANWAGKRLPTEFEWEAASGKLDWGLRWEWTNSAYLPYPRFAVAAGAVGEYNGKFMVNQMVLRGASVATPEGHSRITYRNFFHPDARWQFSGIRLAERS